MSTIAVIGGDGIGPEVTAEAVKVLQAAAPDTFHFVHHDLGASRWQRTGEVLTDDDLAALASADAILLGAVGAAPGSTEIPSGLLERGLLLKLRFAFDHGINLRPSRYYPGVSSPLSSTVLDQGEIDFVVVREGTEGLYCGNGGSLRTGTPHEVATETSLNTAHAVERVVRDAFTRAQQRRGHVTLLHKHNVLTNAGALWKRIFTDVGAEFADVETAYMHIDAAMIHMVTRPQQFDVIVTDNLFGDIVTDLAAAVTGGIGLAASANLNVSGEFPSMFEPVHGSAPDIAGQGIADPVAAISSAALLLRHIGHVEAATRVEDAVTAEITGRDGEPIRTAEVGDRIAAALVG